MGEAEEFADRVNAKLQALIEQAREKRQRATNGRLDHLSRVELALLNAAIEIVGYETDSKRVENGGAAIPRAVTKRRLFAKDGVADERAGEACLVEIAA